jgi:hypothetical protein
MIVAIQSNLQEIADGLRQRGYTVVDLYSYDRSIDAVVYDGKRFDFSAITEENSSPVMNAGSRSSYGVFIVCANGRGIEEIDYMLKTRCYSSFF